MKYLLRRFVNILIIIVIYVIFIIISLRQPANSQVIDSSFYQWTVYEIEDEDMEDKQCYIVAHPIRTDSNHSSRQNPYVMITRFQKDRTEEVSIFGGYDFKINSKVFMMIDERQFNLIGVKDIAWTKTKIEDAQIISNMLNSGSIKIRSDSAVGTYAIDEYSLKGITKAYARMREVCR